MNYLSQYLDGNSTTGGSYNLTSSSFIFFYFFEAADTGVLNDLAVNYMNCTGSSAQRFITFQLYPISYMQNRSVAPIASSIYNVTSYYNTWNINMSPSAINVTQGDRFVLRFFNSSVNPASNGIEMGTDNWLGNGVFSLLATTTTGSIDTVKDGPILQQKINGNWYGTISDRQPNSNNFSASGLRMWSDATRTLRFGPIIRSKQKFVVSKVIATCYRVGSPDFEMKAEIWQDDTLLSTSYNAMNIKAATTNSNALAAYTFVMDPVILNPNTDYKVVWTPVSSGVSDGTSNYTVCKGYNSMQAAFYPTTDDRVTQLFRGYTYSTTIGTPSWTDVRLTAGQAIPAFKLEGYYMDSTYGITRFLMNIKKR